MLHPSNAARRIDTETLKRERPLADVVASYGIALRREGAGTYRALCPFHQEHTPSFWIDARDSSAEHYYCFGCLPPGSLVKTADGMRPIEKVRLGDKVYAGDGQLHEVTRLHEHLFNGELVRLVCSPFKVPILLTPDHKVPVLRPRNRKREVIAAGELRPQNYLIYPAIQRFEEPLCWSALDSWISNRGPEASPLPPSVDVAAFAEWLGWYIAEGSTSNDRTVRLSLGIHEVQHAKRLQELTRILFGKQLRFTKYVNHISMRFCHALLAKWLKYHCGHDSHQKRLPSFVWTWTASQQWTLFQALMLGDGHTPSGARTFRGRTLARNWSIGLASATLIDDIRDLLLYNGVVPSSLREYRKNDGKLSWYLELPSNMETAWGRMRIGEIAVRIRGVAREPYSGPVFNLTVAHEHTYVTFSGTVCNCSAHGDVLTFVMERESCSFVEACERLSSRGRPPVVEPAQRSSGKLSGRRWEQLSGDSIEARVLELALQVYENELWQDARAQAYLQRRGVSEELARAQRLGYADGHAMLACLRDRKESETELLPVAVQLGLVLERPGGDEDRPRHREFFLDRVIIPELRQGRPIWCIGRAVEDEVKTPVADEVSAPVSVLQDGAPVLTADSGPTSISSPAAATRRPRPKYLGLPGEKPVMGLEHVQGRRAAFIVEGPFDMLAAIGWKLPAFAICGTHFPSDRLPALADALAIYGVFDPDRAGRSAAERFALMFGSRWRPVRLPSSLDLAELAALGAAGREMFDILVGRARAAAWQRATGSVTEAQP